MFTTFTSPIYRTLFKICFALYIIFSLVLVARSSYVAIDHQRHFVLFDDAMISMRYAHNLVLGNGLVWNMGEHIEGFTNPLMVFIMAGAIAVFGTNYSMLFIQLLGVVCLALNVYLVKNIVTSLLKPEDRSDFILFISLLLTMAWYPVIYWSVFGMETGFLTTLVLFIISLSLKPIRHGKIYSGLALLLSLVYLTRPEGALFIAIFYAFRAIQRYKEKNGILATVVEAIITALPIIGYQLFRLYFYHLSYPNTYILKATGMPLEDRLKNGIGFFSPFITRISLFIIPVVLFFFVYIWEFGTSFTNKLKNLFIDQYKYITMFTLCFGAYAAYQIWAGGDPWPPFWRMTVPYTILFFIAFILSIVKLKKSFHLREDLFLAFASVIVTSLLVLIPFDYHYDFMRLEPYQTRNNKENIDTSLVINELTTPNATISSFWAGTIPYLTERYSLDPLGKTDAYIATLAPDLSGALSNPRGMYSIPGHNKYDLNYTYIEKKPDVIVYLAFNNHYCSWASQNLEEWCSKNYKLVTYKGVKLLLRNDSKNVYWDKITS